MEGRAHNRSRVTRRNDRLKLNSPGKGEVTISKKEVKSDSSCTHTCVCANSMLSLKGHAQGKDRNLYMPCCRKHKELTTETWQFGSPIVRSCLASITTAMLCSCRCCHPVHRTRAAVQEMWPPFIQTPNMLLQQTRAERGDVHAALRTPNLGHPETPKPPEAKP